MIKYKSDKERLEFHNPLLNSVVFNMTLWLSKQILIDIVITEVFRTIEEQKKIYGEDVITLSPHTFWNAVDIRTSNLIESGIDPADIKKLINENWAYNHGKFQCAVYGDERHRDHIHLQSYYNKTKFIGKKHEEQRQKRQHKEAI